MTKLERIILNWPPIAFVIRKSKALYIPGFQGIPLYDVVVFFIKQVNKIGLNERAAAISFNLIMALPATILFLFSILPYFPEFLNIKQQMLALFEDISPNSNTYKIIANLMDDLMQRSLGVFSFGFLLVVYYASNAMMSLIITFDRSIMEHKRFFLHQRWKAIQLTTIIILLLIASTLILLGQEQLTYLIKQLLGVKKSNLVWLNSIRWVVIIGLFFYGIAFIYKYAPSVKIRWKLVSPGSLLATALILSTTLLFSYWVNNFGNYNKVYGSIGTIMILMILAYINSLILLIGFELNVSITYLTQHAAQRKKLQESNSGKTSP
ncbi:YihY/virulence factor BrkB family protein [Sediminibacterium sp.]|jgi:membrane protein|uniref:YihY/virulence factor BrkB family protein n=1 Tax=Sediminibacterium sp. TaxID=1917865 RepID=UPI001B52BB84|nr:YihY/virulence factor BrkB family protein [Sediminibacterium sp.]MBP7346571.1 YihY/virulence factor BrkB family protein [Sediminibacterium sp.]MDO8996665.1 YihY/virulence factor BrkB family protein [Sediminibacterium sp.]MDO9156173.1 YihY/virulence factor BrkB family protein [Sediminibacterium sp.]MDP1973371.1 YihY/virulence factor BrkB family protein [Sediminibacterium sp.]MDP2422253.1 YihY/virulence factor BrkB family protein [Sediminibacterium sp.]